MTLKHNSPGISAPSLPRVLGVTGLAFASFNSIVGSGIFGLPALVAALLGPAAMLAYLVCVVLIALMGLCFAEAGSRVNRPGGLYAYAHAAFGPVVGGVAGTLNWIATAVVPSAAIANFLTSTLAVAAPALASPLPRALFLAFIYLTLAAVNIRGTRMGAGLSVTIGIIKLTPLVLLVVAGSLAIHAPNLHWTSRPDPERVGQGAVLLFFAFMGVESGLSMSGEVRHPARTVPRAIALCLTLIAVLYIGLQLVAQGVLGPGLAVAKAPLVATATAVFGPWGTRLLWIATLVSAAGYLTGDVLCSPRLMHALAGAGQLPRPLAGMHPRFGTPAVAIGTYALLCFVVAVSGSFRQLVIIASSSTLLLYLICCLGLLRLRARQVAMAGTPFPAPGGAFVPLAAAAMIVWMLTTLPGKELAAAAGLVVVSGIIYGIRARRTGGTAL